MSQSLGHQNCEIMLAQFNDYVDGELPARLCETLETHLAACENCQIVLDTLRKTIHLVHRLPDAPDAMPDDVEQRLFMSLQLDEFLNGPAS